MDSETVKQLEQERDDHANRLYEDVIPEVNDMLEELVSLRKSVPPLVDGNISKHLCSATCSLSTQNSNVAPTPRPMSNVSTVIDSEVGTVETETDGGCNQFDQVCTTSTSEAITNGGGGVEEDCKCARHIDELRARITQMESLIERQEQLVELARRLPNVNQTNSN